MSNQPERDHLFINYATEDGELAEWLTLRLTNAGYKVWCDRVKLLGGESYPRDIDKAIKTQTFRVIALLSHSSVHKENPLKERTLAHNISKERGLDFIIPLLAEDMNASELGWMESDLTYIPFHKSWADGLRSLIKKLSSVNAPQPVADGRRVVAEYMARDTNLANRTERVWSNLFKINSMPNSIYRIVTTPDFRVEDVDWVFHSQADNVLWSFEVPQPGLDYVALKWQNSSRVPYGIPPIDIATILIGKHIRRLCLEKKALETPDGEIYLSSLTVPNSRLKFTDYRGKSNWLLAAGERTVKSMNGTTNTYRYHLSPVFRPVLRKYSSPMLELQVRLYLADATGVALSPTITNRRRKRITKSWWNYQWLSRVFALGEWAFGPEAACNLAAGRNYELMVNALPLQVTAKVGIDEESLGLHVLAEESSASVEDDEEDDLDDQQ